MNWENQTYTFEEVELAIRKAGIFCMGCAKQETWVWPPKPSSIVGQAAVHSSGLICIPNTIRMLLKGRGEES